MHLVRNSIDHGIESREERLAAGKPECGTVTLEAYNAGSNVFINVKDDGKGLNKEKILKKAIKNNLLTKPESEMSDKEIYNLIFLPGFSTNETVTEFSGRGVGMDVVMQNISSIGGTVSVESVEGKGTTTVMKIPLTVAIIDGMNISAGNRHFTIPTSAIRESFKPDLSNIVSDTDGNEMIMVRGQCYAIMRLHKQWGIDSQITNLTDGILMMIEQDDKRRCIFVDNLIGQQQVVVKTIPDYIKKSKLVEGISGCTLLGDGSISLILDAAWLVNTDIN
jgi:two-component system chemotaxis sensor kinase CheA